MAAVAGRDKRVCGNYGLRCPRRGASRRPVSGIPATPSHSEQAFRELYKELVEINTRCPLALVRRRQPP